MTVVSVYGELDFNAADDLAARSTRRVPPAARTWSLVDLVGRALVDSTALGIIAGAAQTLAGIDGGVSVVASDPRLVRIFRLTGLDRTIPVERSLAEAIARPLVRPAAV